MKGLILLLGALFVGWIQACADSAPEFVASATGGLPVRASVLAGRWYPDEAGALRKEIDGYLAAVPPVASAYPVRALVVPHAGYRWSGPTAAYGYNAVKGKNYKRVVLLGPSHTAGFRGGSIAPVSAYATPLGMVSLDREACDRLLQSDIIHSFAQVHEREHSLEIQLPFLQVVLGDFQLIPVVIGQVIPADVVVLADLLRPLLTPDTLLVLSSDFTHQGPRFDYVPFKENVKQNVQRLDFAAINPILNLDARGFWHLLDQTQATICGRNPIQIGMMALPAQTQVELAHYTTSGEATGDYAETVSYAALVFRQRADYLDRKEQKLLLAAARMTLEQTFAAGKADAYTMPTDVISERLKDSKGVFVTLSRNGRLRGCIGQLEHKDPLYQAVPATVLLSAFGDRRFSPLEAEELATTDIEISLMSPMQSVPDWKTIVLGRDGIRLAKQGRSALFLPQVALEQGWSIEETLQNLCLKAGLPIDAWMEGCRFETFTAQVFGETFWTLTE